MRGRLRDELSGALTLTLGLLVLVPGRLVAAEEGAGTDGSDEAELASLMEVLETETEIATKSRLNSDFVPGTVTVLRGDDLESLGARTVGEALSFVPGIFALFDPSGTPLVTVRGIVFPFNSGNIKVMVDGTAMTQQSAAINSSVLMIPIELVERIEFIRGPGSTVHGDFAFHGLLNIVTRQERRRVFAKADGFATACAGAELWSAGGGDRPRFGASLSALRSGDALASPGVDAEEQRTVGIGGFSHRGFSASIHVVSRDRDQDGGRVVEELAAALELRHSAELADELASDARLSYLRGDVDFASGFLFKGDRIGAAWDLTLTALARQTWLFSIDYSDTAIDEAIHVPPLPPDIAPAPEDASDTHRRILGVSLQDQIELGEDVTATVGVRYERLDRTGVVTPRLALVWRATEHQIVKAQYAEGYRGANFFELYGTGERNDDLDPESVRTAEASYIYHAPRWVARATLFSSRMRDLIQPAFIPPPGEPTLFANVSSARARGGELEWEQRLSSIFRAIASVSYADIEDTRPFGVTPRWIGNLGLLVQPWERLVAAAHWYHAGERGEGDESVPGFDLVDLTTTLSDLGVTGLSLRAGLKNALDDEVVLLDAAPGHREVIPFDTRTWWAQVAYRF